MKVLHNIFSKKKLKKKTKNPIIVDTRETQSLVVASLIEKNVKLEFEKLNIGDYIIRDTVIERKTFQDFVSSIINKRLIEQLENLNKYRKKFLLVEGFDYDYENSSIHGNAIRGMLLSIATEYNIPMIFTENSEDTSKFLIILSKRLGEKKPLESKRQSKTLKSLGDQKQFILEGFPGIGPTIAKRLLKKYKSLRNIFNLSKEELSKIKRFNENKIKKFKKLLGP